jgi:hypothetical protein
MDTLKSLKAHIAQLEAKLAASASAESGRIWPDLSKAVKEGKEKTCGIVLRGVNANPRFTLNLYPSQFVRVLQQLPSIVSGVLAPPIWSKLTFRSDDERKASRAYLEAYLGESGEEEES